MCGRSVAFAQDLNEPVSNPSSLVDVRNVLLEAKCSLNRHSAEDGSRTILGTSHCVRLNKRGAIAVTPNQPLERTPPRCALRRRSRAR